MIVVMAGSCFLSPINSYDGVKPFVIGSIWPYILSDPMANHYSKFKTIK